MALDTNKNSSRPAEAIGVDVGGVVMDLKMERGEG